MWRQIQTLRALACKPLSPWERYRFPVSCSCVTGMLPSALSERLCSNIGSTWPATMARAQLSVPSDLPAPTNAWFVACRSQLHLLAEARVGRVARSRSGGLHRLAPLAHTPSCNAQPTVAFECFRSPHLPSTPCLLLPSLQHRRPDAEGRVLVCTAL